MIIGTSERYSVVAGTVSMGGGWLIADARDSGDYLEASPGKEWRTQSRAQADEVLAVANQANRTGSPFVLPKAMTAYEYAQACQARKAQKTGAVVPSGREVLRGYSIRYNIVSEVDGQGEDCAYCSWSGPITHQVYATAFDDKEPTTWSCCGPCVLRSIDEMEDVDHEKPVIVEKVQQ